MPTLFGYHFSLSKLRHHWLITGLSKHTLTGLKRIGDGVTIATTTVGAIQKLEENPPNQLSYTNIMLTGTNQLIVYYLNLINIIREYNKTEQIIQLDHIENNAIPHTKLIALL